MGVTLLKVDEPDRIEVVKLDLRKLHREDYRKVGYKSRRVFDIDISGIVTEYQAEVLEYLKRKGKIPKTIVNENTKLSFLRKQESSLSLLFWIPTCVGMTQRKRMSTYLRRLL